MHILIATIVEFLAGYVLGALTILLFMYGIMRITQTFKEQLKKATREKDVD